MSFNKYQENILKKWSSMSKTYSTMHSISAEYYSAWDKRLGIPVIILGAVASSSIFSSSDNTSIEWDYINGAMVLLMTGISGISKFLGTHEKRAKHTSAAFKYTHIAMNIDTLLSFPRDDRVEDPRQFINEIKLSILEVREHSPDLPTWVVSGYINKMDKSITNTQTTVNRHQTSDQFENLRKINEWNNTPDKHSTSPVSSSEKHTKRDVPKDSAKELKEIHVKMDQKNHTACDFSDPMSQKMELLSIKLERLDTDMECSESDEEE